MFTTQSNQKWVTLWADCPRVNQLDKNRCDDLGDTMEFSCLPPEILSDGDSRWTGNALLTSEISAGQIFT